MPPELVTPSSGLVSLKLIAIIGALWVVIVLTGWRYGGRRRAVAAEIMALGVLLWLHILFFWRPLLSPDLVPNGGGDFNSFFFPLQAFAARTIQHGHLPLWNPYLFSGMPHLANYQAGLFYIPNWFAYVLARPYTYQTLEALALAHYSIASVGAYILARLSFGLRRTAALGTAVGLTFSGFLVAHLGHYSMIATTVWIPWLWLGIERLVTRRSWPWVLVTGFSTLLLATGGHQQSVLYGLISTVLWWLTVIAWHHGTALQALWQALLGDRPLWPTIQTDGRELIGSIVVPGSAMASGLALAGPALLPSMELASRSVRAGGLSYDAATAFSFEPVMLAHFLLPHLFGSNPTNYWGPFSSTETWGYPGVVTLVFAALALALAHDWRRWVLAVFGILALLHALGPASPLHGWVYRFVPFDHLLRVPARTVFYVDFVAALLAGIGIDALARSDARDAHVSRMLRHVLLTLGITLITLLGIVSPLLYQALLGSSEIPPRIRIAIDDLNVLVLLLGLLLGLFWNWRRRILPNTLLACIALGLLFFDLAAANAGFNPTSTDLLSGFHHQEAITFLKQHGADREQFRIESATVQWQPNAAAILGFDDAAGLFDPMQPAAYARALDTLRNHRDWPAYDLLNVRYLITRGDITTIPGFQRVITTADGLAIWERPTAMPRAWLSGHAIRTTPEDALNAVLTDHFDPHTTLYISGPTLPPADPAAHGEVRIEQDGPNIVNVQVTSTAPAYLVLAETADPGWHASLDGHPTPIALADGIYQAVWTPAGQHSIVFHYSPPYLGRGLALAGVGMLILLLTTSSVWFMERRLQPATQSPILTNAQ